MKFSLVVIATVALIVVVNAQGKNGQKQKGTNYQNRRYGDAQKGLNRKSDQSLSNDVRERLGGEVDNVDNDRLNKITGSTRRQLQDGSGYQSVKDIAGKVRTDLGLSTNDISNEELDDVVQAEEDAAADAEQKAIDDYNNSLKQ